MSSSSEVVPMAATIAALKSGAHVLVVDRDLALAERTVAMIAAEGGEALAFEADITREADCAGLIAEANTRLGRIDILHNNVGIGAGDS